jgi:hypothetical protein
MAKTLRRDVIERTLKRHIRWENGGEWRHVAGDFDGQGISLGSIQFAAGQGTLQPILRKMMLCNWSLVSGIFGESGMLVLSTALETNASFVAWAKSINDENLNIPEPWHSRFEKMANTDEFKAIEMPHIEPYITQAESIINWFNDRSFGDRIDTDRGFDLAFDIACQQWTPAYYPLAETAYRDKLVAVAYAAKNAPNVAEQWRQDVWERKFAIAVEGWVHGAYYKGEYDDQPMYREDYDMANVFTGEPELNEVRDKPEPEVPEIPELPFTDVDPNKWSTKYVAFLKREGLFKGRPDGTCGINEPATNETVYTLIARVYAKLAGMEIE